MAWPIVITSIPNCDLICALAFSVASFFVLAVDEAKAVSKASVASITLFDVASSDSTSSAG